jgi:signal transduction histidine kinase
VRAVGFCQSAATTDGQVIPGVLLVPGRKEIEITESPSTSITGANTDAGMSPLLTTASEVHRLKREAAERGYTVRIRGVVTSILPEHQAFTIQDSTRGLYVEDHSEVRSEPPQVGEYLEVEGMTDPSLFAPIVKALRVTSLGEGHLPDPVRPTWDQLMNGSLDAQYVEIPGIVTGVETNVATLLVRGGVIKIDLRATGVSPADLSRYEDSLVRVRGCLFASWDYITHQVKMGEVRINGADILVDEPAPVDLFSTPRKTAAELRLFDPQAGVFQRVRVSGQVIYARDPEYLMVEDGKGVRFISKKPAAFEPGDELEVVGFPELLSSASPVLREAVARQTGHSVLPPASKLSSDELIDADHDSTYVRVEGFLVNVRTTPLEQVLEMQSGVRSFVARLEGRAESVRSLTVGSKLQLTGVYAGQGGNRAAGQDIASFELLLNSAADVKVLARPPWWTLQRLLIIVGALACVLFAALVWIKQLHLKVEERTRQLEKQIRERQRVEQQRALEQERSRVAQDLHDDLGAGLTEISILGKQARSSSSSDEQRKRYLKEMDDKARQMVGALDEIVWAMNPTQDSLASLVSYFCLYADRFLGLANISWQLEETNHLADLSINSLSRHELFLAFKEALTNVVRHSGATEVRLNIQLQNGELLLLVADNGRGLPDGTRTAHMDGLSNMRTRMEKMGGRFECRSEPGRGTTLHFWMPTDN